LALAHRRSADAAQPPSPSGQANDPNGQQAKQQQPQQQQSNQAPASKADAASSEPNANHSQPDGWGGMAAPRHTGIEPVKALRPFIAKKA
jgi:magnesium chelatase subunit I